MPGQITSLEAKGRRARGADERPKYLDKIRPKDVELVNKKIAALEAKIEALTKKVDAYPRTLTVEAPKVDTNPLLSKIRTMLDSAIRGIAPDPITDLDIKTKRNRLGYAESYHIKVIR